MQQTADDVDQAKRSSTPDLICSDAGVSSILVGSQLRENLRKWLSPPDPSTNHNMACGTHHKGTATWFLQSSTFQTWKFSSSLLWIHGKRMLLNCHHIIPPDRPLCQLAPGRVYSGSSVLDFSSKITDITSQFHNHTRH